MKATYPVQGMSCAACAVSVESMLKSSQGVNAASVNFANQTALVEFDPALASPEALKKAVQSIGYDLLVEPEENVQESRDKMQGEQLKKIKFQTIGALVLAAPVAIIGMFLMDMPYANYIQLVLAAPVVFGFGGHFFQSAWKKAMHGQANMDTLVAVSTGVAFFFSLFTTFFPEYWHQRGLHPHVYYEAAAVVIAFVSLGKWLEEKAKSGTSEAIKKLIGLQAKTVFVLAGGQEKEIAVADVQPGDVVLAKPGGRIAVDGVLSFGTSYVDESSITGEPLPASKSKGDKVFAGTINQQGAFHYIAEKVGSETLIAQIIQMVQEAQASKAPVQRLVDKVAGVFVPVVMGISLLTFIAWLSLGGENAFSEGLLAAVTVLVIACPCALGLATPTAIMVGVGKAAEEHILIKDAESLETAHRVNAMVLDKTGTITQGHPEVMDIHWYSMENGLADVLYTIESSSGHPLAQALALYLREGQTRISLAYTDYLTLPGRGVEIKIGTNSYFVGNRKLLDEKGLSLSEEIKSLANEWTKEARTVVYFASSTQVLALISLADKVKENSKTAIEKLQAQGIEVYMLTGDNKETAQAVAKQVGITHFQAEALPSNKADFVAQLQKQGKIVAMVGDGINDSQALAQADVSIAMGKGSDIAIDVAKITLLTSDLMAIPKAISLSKATVRTIRQNLFWAFVYNLVGIPIAAGLLYPMWGILLDPMMASAAMALSSVSVVVNSLRLKVI